jgi:hypothetical protein
MSVCSSVVVESLKNASPLLPQVVAAVHPVAASKKLGSSAASYRLRVSKSDAFVVPVVEAFAVGSAGFQIEKALSLTDCFRFPSEVRHALLVVVIAIVSMVTIFVLTILILITIVGVFVFRILVVPLVLGLFVLLGISHQHVILVHFFIIKITL